MTTTSRPLAVTAPARRFPPRFGGRVAVEVLACGRPECGDDGLAAVIGMKLRGRLPSDTRVRVIGRLDIDDLLAIATGARAVIVDVADGVRGGRVVRLPLDGIVDRRAELRPRLCGALGFPEVLGVAGMVRGHPLAGEVILIGGVNYGVGAELSPSVRRAIPKVLEAVGRACMAVGDPSVTTALRQPGAGRGHRGPDDMTSGSGGRPRRSGP